LAAIALAAVLVYLVVWSGRYGLDLEVYRASVSAWTRGADPYSLTFTRSALPFTYPPFALVALWPLDWASFALTHWLMELLSIAAGSVATWIVLRAVGRRGTPRLWCIAVSWACLSFLLLEPARSGLDYGQIEAVLMLAVLLDTLVVPRRYRGFIIGAVAAVKLTPLVFVLVLLVDRDWRSSIRAGATLLGISAMTWLIWPDISHAFWTHDVVHPARVGPVASVSNQSLFGIVHRVPFPAGGSVVGWLVASAVVVTAGTYVAWQRTHHGLRVQAVMAIALVGLLVSPISWSHHWVWLVLFPPMLVGDRLHTVPRIVRLMLWGLVVLALLAPYWWLHAGIAADILDDSLAVWAFLTVVAWAVTEWLMSRTQRETPAMTAAVPSF